eukprot:GFUD01025171.1.p1 GENE.GFUD01025171.1~~GFUD01025171.1.p1  ORF type:complete len:456 (+),score=126.63 GFUD01025171.1:56-1369(+)
MASSIETKADYSTSSPLIPDKSSVPPGSSVLVLATNSKKCQGRTCVSVNLKSSRLAFKLARLKFVAERMQQVEQLACSQGLKFGHKSSPGVQARLEYCFHLPADARQFHQSVIEKLKTLSHSPPKLYSCLLLSEPELGYQHRPVLTEQDLLAIQSSDYCRNIFRTSRTIRVEEEEGTVAYHFMTVVDVNMFIFNKSSSAKTRTLGLLRMNIVPKKLVADEEGYFRLFTREPKISPKLGKRHNFKIKPEFGGHLFLFSTKFGLFKFLVSEDAAEIDHLQFDETKIENYDVDTEQAREKIDYSIKQETYKDPFVKEKTLNMKLEDFFNLVRVVTAENEEKGRVIKEMKKTILELEMKNKLMELTIKQKVNTNRAELCMDTTTDILGKLVLDTTEDEEPFATMSEFHDEVTTSVTSTAKNYNQITTQWMMVDHLHLQELN